MKIIEFIKNKKLLFSTLGLFLIVSFVSISYASMNTSMMITGSAYVRVDEEIRVVGIKFLHTENEGYETYKAKYSKNSTNMYTTLPNINSKITYQVEIENKSDHVYLVSDITGDLVNPNITYTVEDGIVKVVPKNSKILVNITFQYNSDSLLSDTTQIATMNYKFEKPTASHLQFDNNKVNTECKNVQCALDELYGKFSNTSAVKSKFVQAYSYNQKVRTSDYCVTGEESTCQKTECYKTKSVDSCKSGTIIEYRVNDNEIASFHVMYDNGDTMTMQTQKNTLDSTPWYENSTNNSKGPITVLTKLEEVTRDWDNVNNQEYIMGVTEFGTGKYKSKYTGCNSTTCNKNVYTLEKRVSKARMITTQESWDLGCTNERRSCPIWLYNYLSEATLYGGTNEGNTSNKAYWAMNADSANVENGFTVTRSGLILYYPTTQTGRGARAVVVVSK
ncbi:MAG: hypothetical protein HFJ12_02565 [Bacilli bacterium]|nr:hypothetical protein [Bacilli bacterium]